MTPAAKPKHPNRIPFAGVLTRVDVPSDKPPKGSPGKRVILTRAAAEEALPSLIGMAVNFSASLDDHDVRSKCGVITEALIEGDELRVAGHLFGHDFPEIEAACRKPGARMGMSYDLIEAHVENMRDEILVLKQVTFTGAAILYRDKAAYRSTTFTLSACEARFDGRLTIKSTVRIAPEGHL